MKVTYNLHRVVGLIYLSYISVLVIECLFADSDFPMLALVVGILVVYEKSYMAQLKVARK